MVRADILFAVREDKRKNRSRIGEEREELQSADAEVSASRGLAIPTIRPNLRSIQLWNVSM